MLSGASTYLLTVIVARVLGVEEAGAFFLGLSTIFFLATFSQLGLDIVTLKYSGIFYEQRRHLSRFRLAHNNLLIVMVFSGAIATCVFVFSDTLTGLFNDPERLSNVLRYLSPVIFTTASLMIVGMFLQGNRRPLISILLTKLFFPSVLIVGLLLFSKPSITSVAQIASLTSVIVLVVTLVWWFNLQASTNSDITPPSAMVVMRSASVLWSITLLSQALFWLPQIFAGIWLGSSQVAQLSVTQKTAALVSIILISVNMLVAPRFAAQYEQGSLVEFRRLFKWTLRLSLCFSIPVIVILFLFAPQVLLVFGGEYVSASTLLRVLLFGELLNVICGSVGYALVMTGNEKDLRNSALIAIITSIVLAYFLVQQYGLMGCALAYSLSIALYNLCSAYWVNKRLGFNPTVFW